MEHIKIRCRGVVVYEDSLLVVRHIRDGVVADFYALPGGHLEYGEDPKECIIREMQEELGVTPVLGRLLCVYTFINTEHTQSIEFFFEIRNGADFIHHEAHTKTHAYEIADVAWVKPQDTHRILPEKFADAWRWGEVFQNETRFIKE